MITYRLAMSSDFVAITGLLGHIDKTFPIPLSVKTDLGELARKFLENGYVYLALDEDNPIGMVGFYANDAQTNSAYISVVGVTQTYQRKGIAWKLINKSLVLCKENGMTSCVLYTHKTNAGAIAMYEKLGFTAERDPDRQDDIRFVKKLQ